MTFKKRKITIIVVLLLFIITAFYNGLTLKKYTINTDKFIDSESLRIVVITDLHSHVYGENQKNIANKIKDQNPDIIALVGDIADDVNPIEGTILFLEAIKDIAPIYYVTGNHEIWTDDVDNIKNIFRSYGVDVLENDYRQIKINGVNLIIAGIDDPDIIKYSSPKSNWYKEVYKDFSEINQLQAYKILLSHRPELTSLYDSLSFDMILSGHSHGGQVRIPFLLNGLYAPNQGWFPKYAGGVYENKNYTHIVSRGLSFNLLLPRIFNPPEIVVIDIIK